MLGDDGNVRRTGAIPVDDGGQALHVRTEHLGERFALGVAQLGELFGDVRDRTVVLADLHPADGARHRRRRGGVAGLRQRRCHLIRGIGDVVGGGDAGQDRVDATTREAVVTYDGSMMRGTGTTVEKRRFEARVPVAEITGPGVGPALNQAANQVAGEVADWIGR